MVAAFAVPTFAQSYLGGKFRKKTYTYQEHTYTLYAFSRKDSEVRAKYFAQNAYNQYRTWKSGKTILLVTTGAFSDSWENNAKPVGLCVDNGTVVNRTPDRIMDGMVIVYNGGGQAGGIVVVDLDVRNVQVENPPGTKKSYDPRASVLDRIEFLKWGEDNGLTLFQTQLLYSKDRNENFTNILHGNKRERRFLALCSKDGVTHHVVVDAPDDLELNLAASQAKHVLEHDGFSVTYILNLDTGDRNLLYVHNGERLEDLDPFEGLDANRHRALLENAANLLVYYKE